MAESFYKLSGGKRDTGFIKTMLSVRKPDEATQVAWKSKHPYNKEMLESIQKSLDIKKSKRGRPRKQKETQSNTLDSYVTKRGGCMCGGLVVGHTNATRKTLEKYGNRQIFSLKVVRTPLSSGLNRLLNILSLGKMKRMKQKYKFSDYFHLYLVANIGSGKPLVMEKNERVNVGFTYKKDKRSQTMDVDLQGRVITANELLGNTLESIGKYNFYQYRAFDLNCQRFIRDILKVNKLLTSSLESFIMQPVAEIAKQMSPAFKKIANVATDIAGWTSRLFGKGKIDDLPPEIRDALQKNQSKHKGKIERDFGKDFKEGWELATKGVGVPVMKEINSVVHDPVSGAWVEMFGKGKSTGGKRARVMKMASILRGQGISNKKALGMAWKMFSYD